MADVLGWSVALAGLSGLLAFACLLAVLRRYRRPRGAKPLPTAARLDAGRDWERVMARATADLARAPGLAELHAHAVLKIESAEHAYNRLVLDCAKLCSITAAPTVAPASELAPPPAPEATPQPEPAPDDAGEPAVAPSAPEKAPERQPLAA